MKRAIFLVIAAAIVALSGAGCSREYDTSVTPGYAIYTQAEWSNSLSMDGVDIAMRFAILMAEVESCGATMEDTDANWAKLGNFTFAYDTKTYNKKVFLMGEAIDVKIAEPEAGSGVYEINYAINDGWLEGSMSSAWYDAYKRKGAYQITTNNKQLTETNIDSPWTITICNDGSYDDEAEDAEEDDTSDYITFQDEDPYLFSSSYSASVWYTGNGTFAFSVDNELLYYYETYSYEKYRDWSISEATLTFDNFTNLLVESTINQTTQLNIGSAGGVSISGYTLTYETTSPMIYDFNTSPFVPFGGTELVEVFYVSEYSFPKTTTTVVTSSFGIRTLTYNSETMTL